MIAGFPVPMGVICLDDDNLIEQDIGLRAEQKLTLKELFWKPTVPLSQGQDGQI